MHQNILRSEVHVIDFYVEHGQLSNFEAATPYDLEWISAENIVGWCKEDELRRIGGPEGPAESLT